MNTQTFPQNIKPQQPHIKIINPQDQFSNTEGKPLLLKGIGVLLISVILPALVLLFELNILRTGFDFLAALVLMNFGLIFTPILIVISIGSYFLSKKLLRVSQMNHLFLIVPIFLSIISPNTLLIY